MPTPMESVLVAELEQSDAVLLAQTVGEGEQRTFEILKVLKSRMPLRVGEVVEAELPIFSIDEGRIGRREVLLTRAEVGKPWMIRGPAADSRHRAFYEEVLVLPSLDEGDPLAETIRLSHFLKSLHDEDPLLAKAAAVEFSKAPYSSLRMIKSGLSAEELREALADPALADRFPLYHTLLGICGGEKDAERLDGVAERMWQNKVWKGLGAVLTARIEMRGEAAVEEIEERYFRDDERSLPEIEQAILALRLHGEADALVGRERIIESFRTLLKERERLAFSVIGDLARWGDWESRDRLLEIAETHGSNIPEIRQEMTKYLILYPESGPEGEGGD